MKDNRPTYRISVNIKVQYADQAYSYENIVEAERCTSGKFNFKELQNRTISLNNSVLHEAQELINVHIEDLLEKEALKKAKEDSGEYC